MKLTQCKIIVMGIVVFFFSACHAHKQTLELIDKPITFNKKRIELTKRYMEERYNIKDSYFITPKMVVIHWTALNSLDKSYQAFAPVSLSHQRTALFQSSSLNVSIHFLVDRDGKIYRLMPETWMARHVIGLNHLAIGIENVGGKDGEENLTKAQLQSNANLIYYLKKKYPSIEYLIGHYEYLSFRSSKLWKEHQDVQPSKKIDPGVSFMTALKKAVSPLKLASKPK